MHVFCHPSVWSIRRARLLLQTLTLELATYEIGSPLTSVSATGAAPCISCPNVVQITV
jgi:hypothetical protein